MNCVKHLPGKTYVCWNIYLELYVQTFLLRAFPFSGNHFAVLCIFSNAKDGRPRDVGALRFVSLSSISQIQSTSLRINRHQSESINTNQHQSEPITIRINQHQSDQNQSASSDNYVLMSLSIKKEICIYWHKCSKLSTLA